MPGRDTAFRAGDDGDNVVANLYFVVNEENAVSRERDVAFGLELRVPVLSRQDRHCVVYITEYIGSR